MRRLITAFLSVLVLSVLGLGVGQRVWAVDVLTECSNPHISNSTVCQDKQNANSQGNPIYGRNGVLTKAINIIAFIVGIIAILVIIISGLRFVLGQGDPNTISGAQRALIYSLVGLAIAAMARTIVALVLDKL
ncbi:MAG: rane protein [Candidatus Saccharibacteria bacterium]|nr:rane protein [Candidatus Saccharibacteria bacterium]